jgi:hypothetical protein
LQKEDLIAELKMSKDITGIKKLKVERAKVEEQQEREMFSEITRQLTANSFVEKVGVTLSIHGISQANAVLLHLHGSDGNVILHDLLCLCEITGSDSSGYEDGCLLGCCCVQSGRGLLTFQKCLLPP